MLQKQFAVGTTLGYLTGQETVLLLGIYLGYQALLRLEVKGHGVVLVGVAAHLEHRSSLQTARRRVADTGGMNQTAVEHHVYFLTLQVHVLVLHVRVTI